MNIAILGFGVVGSGVADVIKSNSDSILKNSNVSLKVARILDIRDFSGNEYENIITKNFDDILNDDTIDIVVETMGGLHPAYEYVLASLKAGKSVVTSNKELVAQKGYELLQVARENNVNYFFEASVGGGIPLIRPMHGCMAGNKITEFYGILNGTTNYILTKMFTLGASFEDSLLDAQERGYAERNPDADILGTDAARKITILAALL